MAEDEVPRRMFRENEKPKGGKVNAYCDVRLIKDLEEALDESELKKLKDAGFSGLFEFHSKASFSRAFILMLLANQLEVKSKKELWFLFAGKPVRVSLREFKIVTGLRCGPYPTLARQKKKGTIGVVQPYYGTLFGLERQVTVSRVIQILKKRVVTDTDMRLRYALLVIVDGILLATSQGRPINEEHAEMARDLDKFLSYPWGRLSFEAMVDSIKSRDCWEIANMSVTVQGFVHALQLVVVEAAPSIQTKRIQRKGIDEEEDEDEGEKDGEGGAETDAVTEAEKEPDKDGPVGVRYGVPFLILNAKYLDKKWKESPVEVETIIHPDFEFTYPEEVLNWPGDVEDARIANMLRLARDGALDPKMFKGGRVMSRLVKPVKKKSVQEGNQVHMAKGKGKVTHGYGSRGRKRQRENEDVDCGGDANGGSDAVKALISSSVAELGGKLRKELKRDFAKIVKSSEESILKSVKALLRDSTNVGQSEYRHEAMGSRGRPLSHTPSASVSSEKGQERTHESDSTTHSKGATEESEGRRAVADDAGQDAPDNETEPIQFSHHGTSAAALQSPRNSHSPVSSEFRQAFSPNPASVEAPARTVAETSGTAEAPEEAAFANQTLREIQVSLTKRKTDKVGKATPTTVNDEKADEAAPIIATEAPDTATTIAAEPSENPNPNGLRTIPRRTKRQRVASKTLEEPYHCSTATKGIVGHRKPRQETDAESKAIDAHLTAQLSRLKKLSFFTFGFDKKITHQSISDVVVKRKPITTKLMDVLTAFVLNKYSLDNDGENRCSTEFIDTKFVAELAKLSSKFEACDPKDHFLFPNSVVKYFVDDDGTGMYPSFATVDTIYMPFRIAEHHWVVLCVDQKGRCVSVLGCTIRFITDEEIDKVLKCVATMLPYVLKQVDLASCLTQQDVTPYELKKHANLPQISSLEESGLVTLVLVRHHASNSLHTIQDSEFPPLLSKAKQIVADFVEYHMPLPIQEAPGKTPTAD